MDGQTIVYKLANPITYQLTPQQITSLLGTNNILADAGTVTVTFHEGDADKPQIMSRKDIGIAGGAASYDEFLALKQALITSGYYTEPTT